MDLRSGYPFWPVAHGLPHTYPPLEHDITCDAAIVGGGITGALIAHHFVAAGIDTVVLDKRDIGWGSTSATTGLLQYEIDTPLHRLIEMLGRDRAVRAYRACLEAIGKIEAIVDAARVPCSFQRKLSVQLASRRSDVAALAMEYETRLANGIHLDWLDARDVRSRFSFGAPAALLSYDAAQLDAYQATYGLLEYATKKGLRVFDRTEMTGFALNGSGVELKTDRDCAVKAHRVIFASGYESESFLRHKVAQLISTYAVVSEPVAHFDGWFEQCLLWETSSPYLYLRTTSDGRAMIGGEDEDFYDPPRRDRLIARKARVLQKKFARLFPKMPIEIAFAWAGTFGVTKDGLGYIGEAPECPGADFALCYGGNGITYAVLAAEILRDSFLGRTHEYADVFRFDR